LWRMATASLDELAGRAERLAAAIAGTKVLDTEAVAGGGSLPGEVLPTCALALAHPSPDALTAALRTGLPPVVARILADQVILDPRTVPPEADATLIDAVTAAWRATG